VSGDLSAVAEMREAFDRRRQTMHKLLNDIPGVSSYEPEGAFYCFPSFADVIGREVRGRKIESAHHLAEVVLEEVKVAFVPGEGFGAPGYARFSYALGDEDIAEGLSRLGDLLSE
jgi:aspartate/methionine/tyrosine aminotransferase